MNEILSVARQTFVSIARKTALESLTAQTSNRKEDTKRKKFNNNETNNQKQNITVMGEAENINIINEVKKVYDKIAEYSSKAQLDLFLNYYDDSPYFLSFSSDGKMSNYLEFKSLCSEYYNVLKEQRIITKQERFQVLDEDLVIVGWVGDIIATFKNGDTMIMNNYAITSIFKKIDGFWKIIHDHESSLPPEIIKKVCK